MPVFGPNDNWVTWADNLQDWGMQLLKQKQARIDWEKAHPCNG